MAFSFGGFSLLSLNIDKDKITLGDNNFLKKLAKYKINAGSDWNAIKIIAGETEIEADRFTLCLRSSYFRAALNLPLREKISNAFDFKNEIPFWAMVKILRLIYDQQIDDVCDSVNNNEREDFLGYIEYFDIGEYLDKVYPVMSPMSTTYYTESGIPYDNRQSFTLVVDWSGQKCWQDQVVLSQITFLKEKREIL